jgi:hypothetical protein
MAVTTRELRDLEELERAWRAEPAPDPHRSKPPPPRRTGRRWDDEISIAWAAAALLAWFAIMTAIAEVQPAAADDFAGPWWALAMAVVFTALFMATVIGFAMRRRWAFGVSLVGAALLAADTIICPVTGHHPAGWWVAVPAVGSTGLLAMSVIGLRRA